MNNQTYMVHLENLDGFPDLFPEPMHELLYETSRVKFELFLNFSTICAGREGGKSTPDALLTRISNAKEAVDKLKDTLQIVEEELETIKKEVTDEINNAE